MEEILKLQKIQQLVNNIIELHDINERTMNYTFSGKTKMLTLILMGLGLAASVYGFLTTPDRAWANLLLNGFFFTAIALAGTFFIAANTVGESGWFTAFKRVPEAMGTYLPVGALVILVMVITGFAGLHHVWEWMEPEVFNNDEIIQTSGKKVYLSTGFYMGRTVVFLAGWILITMWLRRISLKQDQAIDYNGALKLHKKLYNVSAFFLVFFAVSSSMSAWDWLMSINVHWFSTLFGWYIFSGLFVSGITMMLLIVLYLKRQGLLAEVNENHIHDLAKYMFAFSVFWTYLWFSQYMLIWYSNIPEEIIYFLERFNTNYRFIVIPMLIINFAFPLVVIMHRYAKRNYGLLTFVGVVLFFGHYLDMFQIIMPGTVHDKWSIGFLEIGMFLGFLGLFLFIVLGSLSKVALVAKNQPFLNEAKQHHI